MLKSSVPSGAVARQSVQAQSGSAEHTAAGNASSEFAVPAKL